MLNSSQNALIAMLALVSVAAAPSSAFAQQRTAPAAAKATSINMEDVPYPYPVQHIDLTLYGNDVRMVYMDVQPTAKPNGRTVVLLHGMNWFAEYFGDTIKRLTAEGFRVIAPDQIGFGRSSKPIMPYLLNDHVANTKAILDKLGIKQAAIVGHSMGGMIATRFAFAHPSVTSHLVLVNQIGLTDARTQRGWTRLEDSYAAGLKRDYQAVRRNIERYFVKWDPAYERYVDMMYGWTLSSEWPRLAQVRALNSQWIYADPVVYDRPHIKSPTLFLSGAEDGRNFRENAKQVVDAIPNAKLQLIDKVGHCPHMEAPNQFFPPFIAFLKT
jgi:pimeloyl-ACP methyl ester carboxylesterase